MHCATLIKNKVINVKRDKADVKRFSESNKINSIITYTIPL